MLESIGLTETQAKIYLYLIKNKKSTILEISRGTNIARTNIYYNINKLIENGLIIEVIERGKNYLSPEHPENLVKMIRNKEKTALEISNLIKDEFKKNKYETKIKFSHGSEGFKKFSEEILNAKEKTIRQIVGYEILTKYTSQSYLNKYWRKRTDKKIQVKILCPYKDKNIAKQKYNDINHIKNLREVRFLPKNLDFTLSIITFDNKINFFAPPEEGYHFIFESASFSKSIKNLFDFLWDISEPFSDYLSKN